MEQRTLEIHYEVSQYKIKTNTYAIGIMGNFMALCYLKEKEQKKAGPEVNGTGLQGDLP